MKFRIFGARNEKRSAINGDFCEVVQFLCKNLYGAAVSFFVL